MRTRLETCALVNLAMTVVLDNATILFLGRAVIIVNKVRKTFKLNTV